VVDPGVGSDRRLVALQAGAHFFVGPDNGLFWPVFRDFGGPRPRTSPSPVISFRALPRLFTAEKSLPCGGSPSLGLPLESLGPAVRNLTKLTVPQPYVQGDVLCGQIIRVDNFGNLVTNISARELTDFLESAPPRIEAGKLVIRKLGRIYADCEEGEPLALINSSNLLEIAVNLGRASEYIGLRDGEILGALVEVSKA